MKTERLQFKLLSVESSICPIVASALPMLSDYLAGDRTNCIAVWRRNVAVVIDPGGDAGKIALFLRRKKLTVGAYWLTHAHPDHMGALPALLEEFPAPVRYHKDDSWLFRLHLVHLSSDKSKWRAPFGNVRKISCDDIIAKVISAPGHTPGGVCYWFEDEGILISGDTIMRGSVGSTRWLKGDEGELVASLRRIVRRVPGETTIFPGHGSRTNMNVERNSNPWLPEDCRIASLS